MKAGGNSVLNGRMSNGSVGWVFEPVGATAPGSPADCSDAGPCAPSVLGETVGWSPEVGMAALSCDVEVFSGLAFTSSL